VCDLYLTGVAPLMSLTNLRVQETPTLAAQGWSAHEWVALIDDLTSRGLFGADLIAGGRVGTDDGWSRVFAETDSSGVYNNLFTRGRGYLASSRILL
jgi:hypothetical protein